MISSIVRFFRQAFARKQECKECGKTLYPCATCGCDYDEPGAAVRCAEWDKIIRHDCYAHHSHDEELLPLTPEERWLMAMMPALIPSYKGKIVAVKIPDGVVASGDTMAEVYSVMRSKNIPLSHSLLVRI